jgi:hypothetical protein
VSASAPVLQCVRKIKKIKTEKGKKKHLDFLAIGTWY